MEKNPFNQAAQARRAHLRTEGVDPRYRNIETLSTKDSVALQLRAHRQALDAMHAVLPEIADAADAAIDRLKGLSTGRLIGVGAGTSGRIAVQDLVELTPTFGWPTSRTEYVMAGGPGAVFKSVEGAEDDTALAETEMHKLNITPQDVVIGVAASGTTPFTIRAIEVARAKGALTISMANNWNAPLLNAAEHGICVLTGPEVVAGSTRMKAGTSQKVFLNTLSTQIMIGLNHVYKGMMVDMQAKNAKLEKRAVNMVAALANCTPQQAQDALNLSNKWVKQAIMVAFGVAAADATKALDAHDGNLHKALAAVVPPARLNRPAP